jgi:hypothetical protein
MLPRPRAKQINSSEAVGLEHQIYFMLSSVMIPEQSRAILRLPGGQTSSQTD